MPWPHRVSRCAEPLLPPAGPDTHGELCVSSLPREPRRRSGFLGEARLDHSPASSANPRLCHLSGFPSSAPWEQRTKGHVPDLIRAGLSPCQLQEAAAGVGAVPGRDGQPRHGLSLCLWGREGGRQAEAFEQSCRGALLHRGSASVAETFKSKGGGAVRPVLLAKAAQHLPSPCAHAHQG